MTIFELVKVALDELYQDCLSVYGDGADRKIIESMSYLTNVYRNLNDEGRESVNYRNPVNRFAYVYKYVAAHGDYIVQVLHELQRELERQGSRSIFTDKKLRVSCIGGGPGSDIIAVLKYLSERAEKEPVEKVICYLLDREQAWADVWTELDELFRVNVALNANFQPLDVTNPESWRLQRKFLEADLFTMSYFVSEVMSRNGVSDSWKYLFDHAKVGSLFLYIDNGSDIFNSYFDNLCGDARLTPIIKQDNYRIIPRFSEQASELAEYQDKFGHNPRIQGHVSYRVLQKKF